MTASCGPAEVDGDDEVRVDAAGPDDWADWRALRLEALRDTPIGFVQTVEQAQVTAGSASSTPASGGPTRLVRTATRS